MNEPLEEMQASIDSLKERVAKLEAAPRRRGLARPATTKQKTLLYAMLDAGHLRQNRDGPFDVEALTVAEASSLICVGEEREDGIVGFAVQANQRRRSYGEMPKKVREALDRAYWGGVHAGDTRGICHGEWGTVRDRMLENLFGGEA